MSKEATSKEANNDGDRLSSLEDRLKQLEIYLNPTPFKRLKIEPIFPIHHKDMPEEVEVRILAYLTKSEYLICKLVCKRWDSLRHRVACMRRLIATPLKMYTMTSKNYPSRYWTVRGRENVGISEKQQNQEKDKFLIVPGLYQKGDETRAHSWNQNRFDKLKDKIVSFKSVSNGSYLRHCGFWLRNHPYENTKLYRLDVSFYMTKNEFFDGEDGQDYYSFHSVNYDTMYICHRGFQLKIDYSGDSDLHKNDASFLLHDGGTTVNHV